MLEQVAAKIVLDLPNVTVFALQGFYRLLRVQGGGMMCMHVQKLAFTGVALFHRVLEVPDILLFVGTGCFFF